VLRVFAFWLLVAATAAASDQSPEIASAVGPMRSAALLHALWSPEALRGAPQDAQIRYLHSPDLRPPDTVLRDALPPRGASERTSIRSVEPLGSAKLVSLTFDLCERPTDVSGYQREIVNYLREQEVPATFFAGGLWMRSHPEKTMQLMADPLFELGNHSWSHANLRQASGDVQESEILWPQAQYGILRQALVERAQAAGVAAADIEQIPLAPRLFRFPYGTCNAEALQRLADAGLRAVQWNVVSGDPSPSRTADGIVQTVLAEVTPGSIVIMHANGRGHGTVQALPRIVSELRARGYQFATVSDLLAGAERLNTADECYELRPGDNRRYDRPAGSHGAPAASDQPRPHGARLPSVP